MSSRDSRETFSQPLLDGEGSESDFDKEWALPKAGARRRSYGVHFLIGALVLSLGLNVYQGASKYALPIEKAFTKSKYAGLEADKVLEIPWMTKYGNTNLTEAAVVWEDISFDAGMVALDHTWAESKGIPRAQDFPWDKSKGLFVLNGYHSLHCLKNIHRAIREYEAGAKQSLPLPHITHCIDSLRSDVICQADDTPRYTTPTKSPESALGQMRQCRDWSKLERWAKERTSCYGYISHKADALNQFQRYQFCPKDSPYWEKIQAHFGMPADWFGETQEELDEDIEEAMAAAHSHHHG